MISPPSSPHHLRRTLEESLLVRHIAAPLESRQGGREAAEVRAYMDERNFDVMALQNCERTTHYVCREELGEGKCQDFARQIEATQIVSSATPLVDLRPGSSVRAGGSQTGKHRHEGGPSGVASQDAPLRAGQPSRHVSAASGAATLSRNESFRETLKPQRLEEAQRLYEKRMSMNQEIDLADCLQICDKRDLILRKVTCAALGFGSKRRALKFFEDAEDLRNNLAHSQDLVLGSSWTEVIELTIGINAFLQRFENLTVDERATK